MDTTDERLLRAGIAIMDEVGHWQRHSQNHDLGSVGWVQATGALEALDRVAERIYALIQQGKPHTPPETGGFRMIKGGRAQ